MNYVRTAVLLAALTALLMGIGCLLGGRGGASIAFFVAAVTNFFAYWNGDRLVLSMHGAQEVDEHTDPELCHIVADLADRAGLPMPRVGSRPGQSVFDPSIDRKPHRRPGSTGAGDGLPSV